MPGESTFGANTGALFRYELRANTWNLAERFDSPVTNGILGASFGAYVSYRDGRLLVVAPEYKEVLQEPYGRLFTYEKVAGAWTLMSTLEPPADSSGSRFRTVVDAGDRMFLHTSGQRGRVRVYRSDPSGWVLEQSLPNPTILSGSRFGSRIDYSDGVLAVTDPNSGSSGRPGVVYLYENLGGQWSLVQSLRSGTSQYDEFGKGMAMRGNQLLVGVPLHHYNVAPGDLPSAWLYKKRLSGEWMLDSLLQASEPAFQAEFGESVFLGDGYALVGDYLGGVSAAERAGQMNVFTLPVGRNFCRGVRPAGQHSPDLSLSGAIYPGCESITAAVSGAIGYDVLSVYRSLHFSDSPVASGPFGGMCLAASSELCAGPRVLNAGESGPFECELASGVGSAALSGTTVGFQAVLSGPAGTTVSNAVAVTWP